MSYRLDRMMVPLEAHGVSVISIGFFADENNPVIWRGRWSRRPSPSSSPRVPLLGQIPLVPELREGADRGVQVVVADPEPEAARAIEGIVDRLLALRAPKVRLPINAVHPPAG
jgi:hypothetical protein